jgi:uncharacterized cofD-like protein
MAKLSAYTKWLAPGIGIKRWLLLLFFGILLIALGLTFAILAALETQFIVLPQVTWFEIVLGMALGGVFVLLGIYKLSYRLLAPYRKHQHGRLIDVVYAHSKRQKGLKVVAIGGGTGLPSVLRGLKSFTSNITAVVTVADDGGSSGRLRRDMNVAPPGDLRNNIAALADDEGFMTRLFQYRFSKGDLGGHAFGNLFISALSGVTGSLETALVETGRVLNIQGRVLPATLENVTLSALVQIPGNSNSVTIRGESKITEAQGRIEQVMVEPPNITAYVESVQAILEADLVIIGPGSLYTSILPNLLVKGISESLRATAAYKIYICNVATQPGETDGYTVAEHVMALEKHIGRGVFQSVIANNVYPSLDAYSSNTRYVQPAPEHHEILQRYDVRYTDLVDTDRPWRHDPSKLAAAILSLSAWEKSGANTAPLNFAET